MAYFSVRHIIKNGDMDFVMNLQNAFFLEEIFEYWLTMGFAWTRINVVIVTECEKIWRCLFWAIPAVLP